MASGRRREMLDLAARQHGAFSTAQAVDAGMTISGLRAWARVGGIRQVRPGVWVPAGVPPSERLDAMAAVLRQGDGATLALSSAGWVWDVPGHDLAPISLLRARPDRRRRHQRRAHTSTALHGDDVTTRGGLPVTTPTRTIFDLAGRQHPERTRRDLNNLMARGLVRLEQLEAQLDRLACRGRPGIAVMRERIVALREGEAPTESSLELTCREILHTAGFRDLEQQVRLGDDEGFIARVDFVQRSLRIAIEVDSDRFHGGLLDRMLDEAKTARLEAAGWLVVRITEREIFHQRAALIQRLRHVLAQARHRT